MPLKGFTSQMLYCKSDLLDFIVKDIKTALKKFGSNIIFSNGLLDPWSGGRYFFIQHILLPSVVKNLLSEFWSLYMISVAVSWRMYLKLLLLLLLKKVMFCVITSSVLRSTMMCFTFICERLFGGSNLIFLFFYLKSTILDG